MKFLLKKVSLFSVPPEYLIVGNVVSKVMFLVSVEFVLEALSLMVTL